MRRNEEKTSGTVNQTRLHSSAPDPHRWTLDSRPGPAVVDPSQHHQNCLPSASPTADIAAYLPSWISPQRCHSYRQAADSPAQTQQHHFNTAMLNTIGDPVPRFTLWDVLLNPSMVHRRVVWLPFFQFCFPQSTFKDFFPFSGVQCIIVSLSSWKLCLTSHIICSGIKRYCWQSFLRFLWTLSSVWLLAQLMPCFCCNVLMLHSSKHTNYAHHSFGGNLSKVIILISRPAWTKYFEHSFICSSGLIGMPHIIFWCGLSI